jgi:hypothetical protein
LSHCGGEQKGCEGEELHLGAKEGSHKFDCCLRSDDIPALERNEVEGTELPFIFISLTSTFCTCKLWSADRINTIPNH